MNHKKLLLTLTLCLCALLCMVVTASASEVQGHANHFSCGVVDCQNNEHGHTQVTEWKPWSGPQSASEDNIPYDHETKTAYIYLTDNVNISNALKIPRDHTLYLCLNGHDIIRTGNLIQIQEDASFTLCDCKGDKAEYGKLDSNKGGRVVSFESTKPGTFTMYGGIITGGNVTGNSGGGVFVGKKNTFTMYGGTITGNSAGSPGGGVVVYGAFNMYGGTVTGNFAREGGGGVAAYGAFTMSGGAITDNTCSGSYNGGGVYVKNDTWSTGAITLSGNVQIKDNYKGSNSNKKPSNIYLANNKEITVDGSLTGSSIGVTTETEPSAGSNVTFAAGSENTIMTGIFTPDTAGVLVGVAADGTSAYLYKCDHSKNTNKTWEAGSSNHWQVCSICGCKANEASHNMVEKDAKAPTCTSAGWDAYNACEVCGYKSGYKEIAALDHDMKNHDAQSPTCTETGHTAYRKCDRSGCNYKEGYELIPKLNHAFAAAWEHNDDKHWHKCTRDGCTGIDAEAAHEWQPATYTAPKTCTVCGATTGTKLSAYYYYSPAKTEDTPGSPKAGDPGVLLYAGLALASLTGLACTAKKRH